MHIIVSGWGQALPAPGLARQRSDPEITQIMLGLRMVLENSSQFPFWSYRPTPILPCKS